MADGRAGMLLAANLSPATPPRHTVIVSLCPGIFHCVAAVDSRA